MKNAKFFGFHYIIKNEITWSFYKMDSHVLNLYNLTSHRNNFLKEYGDSFEKVDKIILRKYL